MHFLCLHGAGTNSQVLEVQSAAIRYELGDQHTYEFVEGTIPWPIAPEITSLFSPDGAYYAYFDPSYPETVEEALHQLNSYIKAEGPFDGLLAFSQGAALAAMYLFQKSQQNARQNQVGIKCAVFLSSVAVYDPVLFEKEGVVTKLDPVTYGQPIKIPTVHIWGKQEDRKADSELLQLGWATTLIFRVDPGSTPES